MHGIPAAANATVNVSSKTFASKYKSKRECFNFLACDVGVYLPPYENLTIYFLNELIGGQKKTLRATAVSQIHIPQ